MNFNYLFIYIFITFSYDKRMRTKKRGPDELIVSSTVRDGKAAIKSRQCMVSCFFKYKATKQGKKGNRNKKGFSCSTPEPKRYYSVDANASAEGSVNRNAYVVGELLSLGEVTSFQSKDWKVAVAERPRGKTWQWV